MDRYLQDVVDVCRTSAGSSLLGLYLTGSAAQGEMAPLSDIDLIAVVRKHLPPERIMPIITQLDPAQRPIPAHGLELMIAAAETARKPLRVPTVDYALTLGGAEGTFVEIAVEYPELLIDMAVCRETGRALVGPPPQDIFGPIERKWLLDVLCKSLEWHRTTIFDPHHDPMGQNSILNAARAWRYAERGDFVSKAQGGRWALTLGRNTALIERALAIREGRHATAPEPHEIDRFLVDVVGICRAAIGD
jgi:hypothetical protein